MKKQIILIIAILAIGFQGNSQVKAADKRYEKMAYSAAITKYEKAIRKDSSDAEVWAKLADCYRLTKDSKKAEHAYSNAVKGASVKPELYLHYAEALMQNE